MEKEIKDALKAKGCTEICGLTVKNVHVEEMDTYVRVSLSLDKPIPAYLADESGTYNLSESKVVFETIFNFVSLFREHDDLAVLGNYIIENPKALEVLLSRAKISIMQQTVTAGEVVENPWNPEKTTSFDHDTILNYVSDCKLGSYSTPLVSKIIDKMLGL
jgi:hypothetical protein